MPWVLTPLHTLADPVVPLPEHVAAGIGRRPTNEVVCRDMAVSGVHCILHCRSARLAEPPEVEDTSTNGTYANDTKLNKGQRQWLVDGDVISLTKPPEDEPGLTGPRIQYRLTFRGDRSEGDVVPPTVVDASARTQVGNNGVGADGVIPEVAPTVPDKRQPQAFGERSFAQDLLVTEQQSKAKITGELLHSQRQLEEERQTVETAAQDLKKIRQSLEEERARRHDVEENRDRLASEVETLKSDLREFQELQAAHDELWQRHESADSELQARLERSKQLEASLELLRIEVDSVSEAHRKASQQHSELSTRARQTQDRADRFEQNHSEAQRDTDRTLEELERLRRELDSERGARQNLEGQVGQLKEHAGQAETAEKSGRESMDAASARRAELECQASAAQTGAEAARTVARQAQQKLGAASRLTQRLREAGRTLSTELRRRAAIWEKALEEGSIEALNNIGVSDDTPALIQAAGRADDGDTVQATCRRRSRSRSHAIEDTAPRPQAQASGACSIVLDAQPAESAAVQRPPSPPKPISSPKPARSPQPDAEDSPKRVDLPKQDADPLTIAPTNSAPRPDFSLLGSSGAEGGGGVGGDHSNAQSAAPAPEPLFKRAPRHLEGTTQDGAPPPLAAGSSTAWSLEVLDLVDGSPTKRPRFE